MLRVSKNYLLPLSQDIIQLRARLCRAPGPAKLAQAGSTEGVGTQSPKRKGGVPGTVRFTHPTHLDLFYINIGTDKVKGIFSLYDKISLPTFDFDDWTGIFLVTFD